MPATEIASAVTRFVDGQRAAQESFLQALVRVPSDNPSGDCAPHAEQTALLLKQLGIEVKAYPVPQTLVQEHGMVSITNLVVREVFGAGGPTIALNAHGDVVPPGQGWQHQPYGGEIVDSAQHGPVMYGRGVAVSKSDFATYTWALLALREVARQGGELNGVLELHFTYDEEAGGDLGPKWLLDEGITAPDLAISAGFSYGVTTAHNGCLHLEVVVHGRQAHAAMPHTGADALEAAASVLQSLYAYRDTLAQRHSATPGIDTPTLTIGLIHGGINTNVVPDLVSLRIDRRMIPEETDTDVEGELRKAIQAAADAYPDITVAFRRIMLAVPLERLPGAQRLIDPLQRHARELFGVDIPAHGVPLYTDARHYAQRGIPTVLYGAGPRTLMEARGHNTDENLRLNDLNGATKVVALTLAELLQGG